MSKKEILEKVNMCIEDIQMLKDEEWVPDNDSCEATLDNLTDIRDYIEQLEAKIHILRNG